MTDLFISYNGADVGWARWVDWQLRAAGYSTVVQVYDFRQVAILCSRGTVRRGRWREVFPEILCAPQLQPSMLLIEG